MSSIFININFGFSISGISDEILKGSADMPLGTLDITLPRNVNLSSSMLVFSYSINDNQPSRFLIYGRLTSSNNIHFERVSGQGIAKINWQIIEFGNGVYVQSGLITQTGTNNIALSSIDPTKTFPLISYRNQGSQFGNDDLVRATITSPTNMEVFANSALGDPLSYQAIEYQNANVYQNQISLNSGSSVIYDDLPITVNLNKSIIIATTASSGNMGADDGSITASFYNSSRVIIERTGNSATLSITYHVIEFTGKEKVLSGIRSFGSADATFNVTLPETVIPNRSIVIFSDNMKGGRSSETDDNMGSSWFTGSITNSTNLYIHRETIGSVANAQWFIIQFPLSYNVPPTNPSSVTITSSDGLDLDTSEIIGSALIEDLEQYDLDDQKLNVTVRWYNGSNLVLEENYDNNYISGSTFTANLSPSYTQAGEYWRFSIRIFDGYDYSSWINSSLLRIKNSNAPIPIITFPENKSYNQVIDELRFNLTSSNPIDSCWYSLDGGLTNITTNCFQNITGLSSNQGTNSWTIYANDTYGNINFYNVTFFVDSVPPVININSPVSNVNDYSIDLEINAAELVDTLWYNVNGANNITICRNCNGNIITPIIFEEGNQVIEIFGNDSYGNIGTDVSNINFNTYGTFYESFTDNNSIKTYQNITLNSGSLIYDPTLKRRLNVAMICGDATCSAANSDVPMKDYIENVKNYTVTTYAGTDNSWIPTDYDVIVISESVNSGDTAWLKGMDVGIITGEGANWDEFALGTGGDSTIGGNTDITIQTNTHYITSPYSTGNLLVSSGTNGGHISGWSGGVELLALYKTSSTNARLLAADKGSTLTDLSSAANRRVFYGTFDFDIMNAQGRDIFGRSIDWAAYNTGSGIGYASATLYQLNLSGTYFNITNVTWDETGTDGINKKIIVNISGDNGLTWNSATNNQGLMITGDSLLVKVEFYTNESLQLSIDNLNITFLSGMIPTINLLSPINNTKYIVKNNNITFSWSVSDDDLLLTCELYLNGIYNNTIPCDSGNITNFSRVIDSGSYSWQINVIDSDNNNISSELNYFTLINDYNMKITKNLKSENTNMYKIELILEDNIDSYNNITIVDYTTQNNIAGSFSRFYDWNYVVNSFYKGNIYGWYSYGNDSINYSIGAVNDFNLLDNMIIGLE